MNWIAMVSAGRKINSRASWAWVADVTGFVGPGAQWFDATCCIFDKLCHESLRLGRASEHLECEISSGEACAMLLARHWGDQERKAFSLLAQASAMAMSDLGWSNADLGCGSWCRKMDSLRHGSLVVHEGLLLRKELELLLSSVNTRSGSKRL